MVFYPSRLHKNATTWLQQSVFSDRKIFRALLSHQEIDELLVRPQELLRADRKQFLALLFDFDFGPSNAALQKYCPVDLSDLGYALPD